MSDALTDTSLRDVEVRLRPVILRICENNVGIWTVWKHTLTTTPRWTSGFQSISSTTSLTLQFTKPKVLRS